MDATGRAHAYQAPAPRDHLVLHLPEAKGSRALLVGLPAEISPAQRATYDVLVSGKSGLYVFYNQGFAPRPTGKMRLLPEETYPSWVPWYK